VPDLNFQIEDAEPISFAVAPSLSFKLKLTNGDPEEMIQSVALRCQIQIEVTRRKYEPREQERLTDLFGEPERWSRTLRPMLWTHASVMVPPFQGETIVDLQVPCTFDFNVAATKYFAGLDDGEVPLNFMFSGSIFYESDIRGLQVEQIPWDRETRYRLPVRIWKAMMEIYYPNTAWLCLRRDVFDRLSQYKMQQGIPTWEETLERLIPEPVQRAVQSAAQTTEDEMATEGNLPS
jgi:Family of unknown function (DUF6084)